MMKKLIKAIINPIDSPCLDAKSWIQKILLEEKYRKINS
jgi:hypothetical protein